MFNYSIDQIVSIELNYKSKSIWFRYKKEIKFLGIRLQKSGYYDWDGELKKSNKFYEIDDINKSVYRKPNIHFKFSNNDYTDQYFNTNDELDSFYNSFKQEYPTLKLFTLKINNEL